MEHFHSEEGSRSAGRCSIDPIKLQNLEYEVEGQCEEGAGEGSGKHDNGSVVVAMATEGESHTSVVQLEDKSCRLLAVGCVRAGGQQQAGLVFQAWPPGSCLPPQSPQQGEPTAVGHSCHV